jgi:hypothetical protein
MRLVYLYSGHTKTLFTSDMLPNKKDDCTYVSKIGSLHWWPKVAPQILHKLTDSVETLANAPKSRIAFPQQS